MAVHAGGYLNNMQQAQAAAGQSGYTGFASAGSQPTYAAPPSAQFPGPGFTSAQASPPNTSFNTAQPINVAIGQILAQTLQNLAQQPGAMQQVGAAGGAAMGEMVSAFARSLASSSAEMARQLAEQVLFVCVLGLARYRIAHSSWV